MHVIQPFADRIVDTDRRNTMLNPHYVYGGTVFRERVLGKHPSTTFSSISKSNLKHFDIIAPNVVNFYLIGYYLIESFVLMSLLCHSFLTGLMLGELLCYKELSKYEVR